MAHRNTWSLGVLLLALACGGGGTEPESRVPEVRAYTYSLTTTAYGDVRTYRGTLTITYASPDSIAARMNTAALRPDMALGFWNVDAYVLYGYVAPGGTTIAHRIRRQRSGIYCEARVIRGDAYGGIISTPSTCTLE